MPILLLFFAFLPFPIQAQTAQVLHLLGEVQKIKGEVSTQLQKGDTVAMGETIRTGAKSLVILKLPPESTMKVLADSVVVLQSLSAENKAVELSSGGLLMQVKRELSKGTPQVEVKTHTASMGVRGTEFFVSADEKNTWMCVKEGKVEVKKGEEKKLVTQGLGLSMTAKKPLAEPKFFPWTKKIDWDFAESAQNSILPAPSYKDLRDFDYD